MLIFPQKTPLFIKIGLYSNSNVTLYKLLATQIKVLFRIEVNNQSKPLSIYCWCFLKELSFKLNNFGLFSDITLLKKNGNLKVPEFCMFIFSIKHWKWVLLRKETSLGVVLQVFWISLVSGYSFFDTPCFSSFAPLTPTASFQPRSSAVE